MITVCSFIQPVGHQLNYAFGWIIRESAAAEVRIWGEKESADLCHHSSKSCRAVADVIQEAVGKLYLDYRPSFH